MSETGINEQQEKPVISKLAVWSMVLGILGFFSQGLYLVPVFNIIGLFLDMVPVLLCGSGLVFCIIALRKMAKSSGLLVGRGFAIAGLIISVLGFFIPALSLNHYIQFFRQAQVTKIDDVSSKVILTFSANRDDNINGLSILITGHVDGSATVRISGGWENYSTYPITKGPVYLTIGGDWYTGECYFEYDPINVSSGNLTIRYVFWEW